MYEIISLKLGPEDFPNFVYFVLDSSSRDTVLIDPAWDDRSIVETLDRNQLTLRGILLTHSHSDHVSAVQSISKRYPVPVYLLRTEIEESGFSTPGLLPCEHEQDLRIGSVSVTCLHTAGHTSGSACYLIGNALFTGDTLFIESCGHCHSPGGSAEAMYESIQYLKSRTTDETLIFPGHQYLGEPGLPMKSVRTRNIYIGIKNREAFMRFYNKLSPKA